MNHTIIIAEIGECFNGDVAIAKKLISIAYRAGCDFAKFQTLDRTSITDDDPEKEWFEKIALSPAVMHELIQYASAVGIKILFTPENTKTAHWIVQAKQKDIKIGSSLVGDYELLRYINNHFQRVFLSTGMCSLDEIRTAVDFLHDIKEMYILHCISEYPTGPLLAQRGLRALAHDDVHLNMMKILMDLYPHYTVGYSDHTVGILAPVVAVAMGAGVIEKHITVDRTTPIQHFEKGKEYLGTDHVLSLEPAELEEMVRQIREVEKMFGPVQWERSEGEKVLRDFLRARFKPQGNNETA